MTTAKRPDATGVPPLAPRAEVAIQLRPAVGEDWPANGLGPIEALADQLPEPRQLTPGTWVAISPGRAVASLGLWSRLLGRRPPQVHLAVRCTALLVRGYARICADEHEVAYGQVPPRRSARS